MCIHLYSVDNVIVEFLSEIFTIKDERTLNVVFFTLIDCKNNGSTGAQLNVLQLGDIVNSEVKFISNMLIKPNDSDTSKIISNLDIFKSKSNGDKTLTLSYRQREHNARIFDNLHNLRLCPNEKERKIMMKELKNVPINRIALNGFTKGKWLVGLQYDVELEQKKKGIFNIRGPHRVFKECHEILSGIKSSTESYKRLERLLYFASTPFGNVGLRYSYDLNHDLFIYRGNPTRAFYTSFSTGEYLDFNLEIPLEYRLSLEDIGESAKRIATTIEYVAGRVAEKEGIENLPEIRKRIIKTLKQKKKK